MHSQKFLDEIAIRIKNRRKELGLSLQDVSNISGISRSTLQRYETGGIQNIPIQKLSALAKSLEMTEEQLLGLDEKINFKITYENFSLFKSHQEKLAFLHRAYLQDTDEDIRHQAELIRLFDKLNSDGKKVAISRISELCEISRYCKTENSDEEKKDE